MFWPRCLHELPCIFILHPPASMFWICFMAFFIQKLSWAKQMGHYKKPISRETMPNREKIYQIFRKIDFKPDTAQILPDTALIRPWYAPDMLLIRPWYAPDTALIRPWYGPDTALIQPKLVPKKAFWKCRWRKKSTKFKTKQSLEKHGMLLPILCLDIHGQKNR